MCAPPLLRMPVPVAFRLRNSAGAGDINLCEAQRLACMLPYRRFAAAISDDRARLGANADRYSVIVSDLHRPLVAGLPAHCEPDHWIGLRLGRAERGKHCAARLWFPANPPSAIVHIRGRQFNVSRPIAANFEALVVSEFRGKREI